MAAVNQIVMPLYSLFHLVNDYYLWVKELEFHKSHSGAPPPANILYLFMKSYSLSEDGARLMAREEIRKSEKSYYLLKDDYFKKS